jgi:hypothetical protein
MLAQANERLFKNRTGDDYFSFHRNLKISTIKLQKTKDVDNFFYLNNFINTMPNNIRELKPTFKNLSKNEVLIFNDEITSTDNFINYSTPTLFELSMDEVYFLYIIQNLNDIDVINPAKSDKTFIYKELSYIENGEKIINNFISDDDLEIICKELGDKKIKFNTTLKINKFKNIRRDVFKYKWSRKYDLIDTYLQNKIKQIYDVTGEYWIVAYVSWYVEIDLIIKSNSLDTDTKVLRALNTIDYDINEELRYRCSAFEYENRDSYEDQTDWSDYNDDLDVDQQSSEFWNQF